MRLAAGALLAATALALAACAGPGPTVEGRVLEVRPGALERVAIVPFLPAPTLSRDAGPEALGALEAADVVARIVGEAFTDAGIEMVAPNDLIIGFEGRGQVLPRQDAVANAAVAARDFGATAIVVGRLLRYREREGGPAGTLRPASVHFEVNVYSAPGGEPLYTGRFDQTQQALSANPLLARRYPGGGTRWLTAAELTRWGADAFVASLGETMP